MHQSFDTPAPVSLYVELGSGDITVRATETTETTVSIDGRDADDVLVEQRGNEIVVIAPERRATFFGTGHGLDVKVTLPNGSDLATKAGSADLAASGSYGSCRLRSGSGDIRIQQTDRDAVVEVGSGDIDIDRAGGDVRIKSGSGDITVGQAYGDASISTGSGDVQIGHTRSSAIAKSGSGSLQVTEAHTDLTLTTASGDVTVGLLHHGGLRAKNVSGNIRVGIPAGIPVWTDVSSITGRVGSNLAGAGEPADGQDYIEVRATTVSGDISLEQR